MLSLIKKKMFIGLLISIVDASNHTKCVSLSNRKCDKKKLKILNPGHMLLMILLKKKLLERFTKTNCQKGKSRTIHLIAG